MTREEALAKAETYALAAHYSTGNYNPADRQANALTSIAFSLVAQSVPVVVYEMIDDPK